MAWFLNKISVCLEFQISFPNLLAHCLEDYWFCKLWKTICIFITGYLFIYMDSMFLEHENTVVRSQLIYYLYWPTQLMFVVGCILVDHSSTNLNAFKIISCDFIPIREINHLTHWGQMTHICIGSLTTIGSDNGLLPGRCPAIIWTSDGILLIGPLGTNFNEILIKIHILSFKKMHLKMLSATCQPICLGLNVLKGKSFQD